jgi:hypothetical protein
LNVKTHEVPSDFRSVGNHRLSVDEVIVRDHFCKMVTSRSRKSFSKERNSFWSSSSRL